MFQMYRIIEITVNFIPTGVFSNSTGGSATPSFIDFGTFHTSIDLQDDTVPISVAEISQYRTHQAVVTGALVSRTWTPRTLGRVYAGVTDGYYCLDPYLWLSTDYNDVNHYGIKWALTQAVGAPNGAAVYTTRIDAVIQAKEPK